MYLWQHPPPPPRAVDEFYPLTTSHWTPALAHAPISCEVEDVPRPGCEWSETALVPHSGFILGVKLMKCLGLEGPSPGKQCHHSISVHLWWGWGVNPLAKRICGGEEQGRFPGNLCIDGPPFPPISSYGLIPTHFTVLTLKVSLEWPRKPGCCQSHIVISNKQKKGNMTCTAWIFSALWSHIHDCHWKRA